MKRPSPFRLRFAPARIHHWATRFTASDDDAVPLAIGRRMRRLGFLTRPDFLRLCEWKSPRSRRQAERNERGFIRAVTATALSTPNERLRIEVLTLLRGVDWPTASVILHFGHRASYPILDVRALWSAGIAKPPRYHFDFWWDFTRFCRRLAQQHSCTMRTLDRALWQYSKERQR
jgi:hypothetical protein